MSILQWYTHTTTHTHTPLLQQLCDVSNLVSHVVSLSCRRPVLQPLVVCGFQELTGNLQDLLTQTVEHIRGQESGITALKLASLTLEGCSRVGAKNISAQ